MYPKRKALYEITDFAYNTKFLKQNLIKCTGKIQMASNMNKL